MGDKTLEQAIQDEVARQLGAAQAEPTGVLTVKRAAAYCGLSTKTLYNLKSAGGGPKAYKQGRLTVYFPADLDEWLRSRLVGA